MVNDLKTLKKILFEAPIPIWSLTTEFEVIWSNFIAQAKYSMLCARGSFVDIVSPENIKTIIENLKTSGESTLPYPKLGSEKNEFHFRFIDNSKIILAYLVNPCEISYDESLYTSQRLLRNATITDQLKINAVTMRRLEYSSEIMRELFERTPIKNIGLRYNLDSLNAQFVKIERDIKNLDIITNHDKNAPKTTLSMNIWENMEYLMLCVNDVLTANGYSFRFDIPSDSRFTYGMLNSIDTAIFNIIDNAYFHNGKDVEVEVVGENLDNAVAITIKDNGTVGIEDCENPFAPFCAGVNVRDDVLGIGLTAAKAQIESVGGTILASSSVDGTTITIRLPCCEYQHSNDRVRSFTANAYMENVRSAMYVSFSSFLNPPAPEDESYF